MKRVYAKEEYCIGCRLCEIYCVTAHSRYPNNVLLAFKKDKNLPKPKITVEEKQPLSFALQCRHCEDPNCVKSCITGAMQKDPETGIISNDEDKCVGCWTCVVACHYGAIKRDEQNRKVASKCDLCSNLDQTPQCVQHCPNEALVFIKKDEVKVF